MSTFIVYTKKNENLIISRSKKTLYTQSILIQGCLEKTKISLENVMKAFEETKTLKQLGFVFWVCFFFFGIVASIMCV